MFIIRKSHEKFTVSQTLPLQGRVSLEIPFPHTLCCALLKLYNIQKSLTGTLHKEEGFQIKNWFVKITLFFYNVIIRRNSAQKI